MITPFLDKFSGSTDLKTSIEKEIYYMMSSKSHLSMNDYIYIVENNIPCPSNILGISFELMEKLVNEKNIDKIQSIFNLVIPRFDSRIKSCRSKIYLNEEHVDIFSEITLSDEFKIKNYRDSNDIHNNMPSDTSKSLNESDKADVNQSNKINIYNQYNL